LKNHFENVHLRKARSISEHMGLDSGWNWLRILSSVGVDISGVTSSGSATTVLV